jgi:pimeloyl-ACP methyl ester carboxylesterase
MLKNRDRVSAVDELSAFEHERLKHFERSGFVGASRWAIDRDGKRTYLIRRGDGPCPTLLVHRGLSHAGDWLPLAGLLPGHVVIPDRPGCGLSYRIDYRSVDYRSAAADWASTLPRPSKPSASIWSVTPWADTLRWPSRSPTQKGCDASSYLGHRWA